MHDWDIVVILLFNTLLVSSEPRANEVSYGIESTILLPSIAAVSEGVPELRLDSSRQHQFSSIGQEEFDEIIFSKVMIRFLLIDGSLHL